MLIGLLPCAGSASRLNNLPKFMLPLKDRKESLITSWVHKLDQLGCSKIIIPCSPTTIIFVNHLKFEDSYREKIVIKDVGYTETMNDTILKSLDREDYEIVLMAMPDTYVDHISNSLIEKVRNDTTINIGAYLWNIRKSQLGKIGQCNVENTIITDVVDKDINCPYTYGWGALVFKKYFLNYVNKDDQHPGYSIKQAITNEKIFYELNHGQYFDCGTIEGYSEYLNYLSPHTRIHMKGLIIILAVYCSNKQSTDAAIECIKRMREVYKYELIITVDNNSPNTDWYSTAKDINAVILLNDDNIHKYEIGAYKKALQYFRADEYIFAQGTIYFNHKIKETLNKTVDARALDIVNGLSWSTAGLQFINKLLDTINIAPYDNNDSTVMYDSFYCNDLFVNELINSGVFDLQSNTKNHSCAFERILGKIFKLKVGYVIKVDPSTIRKIFCRQEWWTL